jgi:anaerobic magnesium-protoporphyrin IX monomethyl ester cyclase
MRALLVQLPHSNRLPSVVPIGIGCISAALRQAGWETELLDIFARSFSREETSAFLSKSKWDLIGINAFSTQYEWAKWFAAEARKRHPQAAIVMGGPLPTFSAEIVLRETPTDICVIGEGEETVKELVRNMGSPGSVAGIKYRAGNGRIATTPDRPYIRDLDTIPFTPYEFFDMELYLKNSGLFGVPAVKTIGLLTSRGCPWRCRYCSRTFRGVRLRSIDKIVEEIRRLQERFGIRGVSFADELVLVNRQRGYELCEKLKPLKIYWDCQGRANVVDLDLLKAMKDSGCTSVGYGVETGSQKLLDAMEKNVTVRQNELAVTNTIKAGMVPVVQMIYGYPGEDLDSIDDTARFFNRVKFYPATGRGICNISLLTPLPGSPLYSDLVAEGKIRDDEEFLLHLDQGYYIGAPLLVNLTEFTDDELLANKGLLEQRIKSEYLSYKRIHPSEWFRDYWNATSSILAVEGFSALAREAFGYGRRVVARAKAYLFH